MLRESRPILTLIVVFFALIAAAEAFASDIGQEVAGQVSLTSYRHYLDDLLYTHNGNNRDARTGPQLIPARENIVATFQSFGLPVELQSFTYQSTTCYNVVATQLGTVHPNSYFVIGAHYDSAGTPGADDNASGVAGVMEIARILSTYESEYTIKYIAFDTEEYGLIGSQAYVNAHVSDDIRGMISMDMIAHDNGGQYGEIDGRTQSSPIKSALATALITYGSVGVYIHGQLDGSDHAPFEWAGYQACLLIEANYSLNSCYHNACDSVDTADYISYTFAVNMTRGAAGYLADNAVARRPFDCSTLAGCDPADHGNQDCNANGVWDRCDIRCGSSEDANANGIPDECEPHETWYVDAANCPGSGTQADPFCKIQDAINAAGNGLASVVEIIVADGIYTGTGNKDLDFGGRSLTLRSLHGPTNCIIDCQGSGRGFYFHSGETWAARVDGLTIKNGSVNSTSAGGAYGAGVYCGGFSGPALANCTISNNAASTSGGGVYCDRSMPRLSNCTISANTATTGGGVCCSNYANATMINCIVNGNLSSSFGGGVYCSMSGPTLIGCMVNNNSESGFVCDSSSPTLTGCEIRGNTALNGAGGLYCYDSSPTLTDCTISGNTGSTAGGISCNSHSSPTITDCVISGNTARNGASPGGGVYCYSYSNPTLNDCSISHNFGSGVGCDSYSSPTLTNCTIDHSYGGGVYCQSSCNPILKNCTINYGSSDAVSCASSSSPAMINCIVSDNFGGGVLCSSSSNPTLTNCTIRRNISPLTRGGLSCSSSNPALTNCIIWGNSPYEIYLNGSGSNPVVTFSDIQGGWAGTGNINADPGFAFADDVHLALGSPCVDAGTNTPSGGLPARDADGNIRPLDGNNDGLAMADMGAYEVNPTVPTIALSAGRILFFVPEGQGGQEPKTLSIRNAGGSVLHWALDWDASWLQADSMQGQSTGEVDAVMLTADANALSHGIYSTILSVIDLQACNSPRSVEVCLYATRIAHVPSEYATIQAAVDAAVPGDTILVADGIYTGTGNKDLDFHGKDITLRSESCDPATCIIDCQGSGRGFYLHSGETADAVVEGFTIRNGNIAGTGTASTSGGGLVCVYSSPTVVRCIISANMVAGTYAWGGAVSFFNSRSTLNNCTISGNAVGGTNVTGGGVYCRGGNPTLINCTISGNTVSGSTSSEGGGVGCIGGIPMFVNCTISGNTASGSASSFGGGVYCLSSSPILTNCVCWGDTPQEIYLSNSSSNPAVTYCDIQGGYAGAGNINADPLFVDAANGNFRLAANSPCIDVGNNAGIPAGITTDLDGLPRIMRSGPLHVILPHPGQPGPPPPPLVVDMGAYEFRLAPLPEPEAIPIGSPIAKPSGREALGRMKRG